MVDTLRRFKQLTESRLQRVPLVIVSVPFLLIFSMTHRGTNGKARRRCQAAASLKNQYTTKHTNDKRLKSTFKCCQNVIG